VIRAAVTGAAVTGATARAAGRWAARAAAVAAVLRRILGVPDYDAYLAHHARCRSEGPPLTRDEFVRRRLEERYARPGARCC
jgi:uncharacterized short protein YbdD (DUF466 family)